MRVAGIDCGTNSLRLLVADATTEDDGRVRLTEVHRRGEVVRLGQGVDCTGRLAPEALERTLAVTAEYARTCRELGVAPGRARFVATSASRDADNAADFVAGVEAAFGDLAVRPEVVSGDEEARLSFTGATGALAGSGYAGPYLVVDLGGGSTELVRGTAEVEAAISLDIGSVRLTERHLRSDPPTPAEVEAARADIAAVLDEGERAVPLAGVGTLVGLAGSITTVSAHALGLSTYDRSAIHLARLAPAQVVAAADDLLHRSRAERAALPYVHPGRVDVIGAGALLWRELVARVVDAGGPELPITVSENDILDGIALSAVR